MSPGRRRGIPIHANKDPRGRNGVPPPIGLVLAARAAKFEAKCAEDGGPWKTAWGQSIALIHRLRPHKKRKCPTIDTAQPLTQWLTWTQDGQISSSAKLEQEWETIKQREGLHHRRPRVGIPWDKAKKIWRALRRHESSCLVQIRSAHIGLGQYLARRNVPDASSPWCKCGMAQETAPHVILACDLEDRSKLPPLRNYREWARPCARRP